MNLSENKSESRNDVIADRTTTQLQYIYRMRYDNEMNDLKFVLLNRKSFNDSFIGMTMIQGEKEIAMKTKSGRIEKIDLDFSNNSNYHSTFQSIINKYEEKVGERNGKILVVFTCDIHSPLAITLSHIDFKFKYIDFSISAIVGYYYRQRFFTEENQQEIHEGCYTTFLSLKEKLCMTFTVVKGKNIYVIRRMQLNNHSQFNKMKILKIEMNINYQNDEKFFERNINLVKVAEAYHFYNDIYDEEITQSRIDNLLGGGFNNILSLREEILKDIGVDNMKQYVIYLNQKIVDMSYEYLKNRLSTSTEIYTSMNYECISVGSCVIADKEYYPDYHFYMF